MLVRRKWDLTKLFMGSLISITLYVNYYLYQLETGQNYIS